MRDFLMAKLHEALDSMKDDLSPEHGFYATIHIHGPDSSGANDDGELNIVDLVAQVGPSPDEGDVDVLTPSSMLTLTAMTSAVSNEGGFPAVLAAVARGMQQEPEESVTYSEEFDAVTGETTETTEKGER